MFKFQELPYSSNALEPVLSQKAVDVHYEKHHRGYYDNLAKMIKHTKLEDMSLIDIIRKTENPVVFNNAAQVYNHDFFWKSLAPSAEKQEVPENLMTVLDHHGWPFEEFKERFIAKAAKHFGSGWIWLVRAEDEVEMWTMHDADTPIKTPNVTPLLCIDLWEHAYYVDYMNDRKAYLEKVFSIINWEFANENLKESM